MSYGYIYKITNMINGKVYIGQHKYTENIVSETDMIKDNYMGSGVAIIAAQEKYGVENFKKEIVCVCENKEDLDVLEIFCIMLAKTENGENCYNIAAGGHTNPFEYMTEEEKDIRNTKVGEASKKAWKNKTAEQIDAFGTIHSELAKKMWANMTEQKKTARSIKFSKTWANRTDEKNSDTYAKKSESSKKAWKNKTEEEKIARNIKISETKSLYKNVYGINKDTGEKTEVFATLYEAKAFILKKGYKDARIDKCLSGKRKSAYGYYWFGEKK